MYQNKIPIYPIFYLLEGDYRGSGLGGVGFRIIRLEITDLCFRGLGFRGWAGAVGLWVEGFKSRL